MIRAVIFDLDQTLLDRDASLLAFLQWQCRGMLRGQLPREDTFIARFLEIGGHDFGGVGLGRVGVEPHELGGPDAQKLVAASLGLEAKRGVVCEFGFVAFFTIVETGQLRLSRLAKN